MVSLPLSSSCWLGRSCDGIGTTVWDPEPGRHTEDSRTSLSAWAGLALDCGARRKYTSTSFAFGGLFVSKSCNIQEGVSSRHLGV